ncbi:NAD(P)H-dependent oxidoreductase [Paenibacillus sp. Marseille-Q4541]|uniref:NAD(P)H-dependent oxidoreductase n=1 Tax=Paenibacillus sp. Marseille-Q4541 TaxID=2831522 RepID=UPI001BA6210B|nr:NAD(P)H-dependent oxidoreductase [Paenibacillus sp. Marseille-Q4541]
MKHLVILAHPVKDSFNRQICEVVEQALSQEGDTVTVRDLYELNFSPTLTGKEMEACYAGELPGEDVQEEQKWVTAADTITMIYPIWWAGLPAIMKGYIDRVFSYGYAYAYSEDGDIIRMLQGKQSLVINTHGSEGSYYDQIGMSSALKLTTQKGILEFVGIQPADHLLLGSMDDLSDDRKSELLQQLKQTISGVFTRN